MDSETRIQALRGAAGAKLPQCPQVHATGETCGCSGWVMERFGVLSRLSGKLFPSVKSLENKRWVIRVPAAAVIPEPQVVTAIIGLKASVVGLISS